MKIKDIRELHQKTLPQLQALLLEIKKSLEAGKMERAQNKLKNTRLIFLKRKELAQVLTVLNEKSVLEKIAGGGKR